MDRSISSVPICSQVAELLYRHCYSALSTTTKNTLVKICLAAKDIGNCLKLHTPPVLHVCLIQVEVFVHYLQSQYSISHVCSYMFTQG